jgi:TolB protein
MDEGLYIDPVFGISLGTHWSATQGMHWSADKGSLAPHWGVDYAGGVVRYARKSDPARFEGYPARSEGYYVDRWGYQIWNMRVRVVRSTQADVQTYIPIPKDMGIGSQLVNTKIAFMSVSWDAGWNKDIFVMNADGTNLMRLTRSTKEVFRPVWSPDGTKIAFGSVEEGVYVIHADGTDLRRLIDSEPRARMTQISWSPDGTKIAFTIWRDCNRENYVMHADGSNRTLLTPIMTANGCNRWTIAPAWSPDGATIALPGPSGSPKIYVINADGTNPRGYGPLRSSDYEVLKIFWSPDGTKIAFESEREGVYVMHADGTNLKQLLEKQLLFKSTSATELDWLYPGDLSWSPDGTKIAFVSRDNDGKDKGEISVINADGTNLRRLTNTTAANVQPVWSPDGTKIAFTSHRYGSWQIYMMSADGTNPTRLTSPPGNKQWPAWSPFLK